MATGDLLHLARETPVATPHAVGFMYDETPTRFNRDVKHFSESHYAGLCRGRQKTCLRGVSNGPMSFLAVGSFEDHNVLQMIQHAGTTSLVRSSQQCEFCSLYFMPRIFLAYLEFLALPRLV